LSRPVPVAVPARYCLPMALDFRIVGALEVAEDSFGPPCSSSLLLVGFSSCGTSGRGQPGRFAAEDEQQRLLMRERHPVCLPGVALDLGGERVVVAGASLVSAVAGERLVHDCLAAG
jgi:hypothetical protein